MPTRQPDRIAMLEAEDVRLQGELANLERIWARKHRLALFGLLAIPAYFLFGSLVAVVVLVCTPALIVVQTYLVGVRRSEVRQLIGETRRELARQKLRATPTTAAEPVVDGVLSPG